MPRVNIQSLVKVLLLFVACAVQFPRAEAADTGNVLAGLLGTAMAIVIICAGLGWWSRRNGGGSATDEESSI